MKTSTWIILVILAVVFIGQCKPTDSVTPEPTPTPAPTPDDDSGSTGAVGSIRDGMAAAKMAREEIEAARKVGYVELKVTVPTKLPAFTQQSARAGTCDMGQCGPLPDTQKSTTTGDCYVCPPEYVNDSPGQLPSVSVPSGNRRGLFTRLRLRRR